MSALIVGVLWDDFAAETGVTGEDAKIPGQVKSRWRYRRAQSHEQVVGGQHKGACPVLPGILQLELESPVTTARQAVLSNGWARDVAAESLYLLTVTAMNDLLGIQAQSRDFSDRLQAGGFVAGLRG